MIRDYISASTEIPYFNGYVDRPALPAVPYVGAFSVRVSLQACAWLMPDDVDAESGDPSRSNVLPRPLTVSKVSFERILQT